MKKSNLHILGVVTFLMSILWFPSVQLQAQNVNAKVEAKILTDDTKDDFLEVTGTAINKTEGNFSLRFELSVITSDGANNNTSKNSQSGRFTLEPYGSKSLSQTSISIDPQARTILLLLIYDADDKLLGTDRIVYDANKEVKAEKDLSYQKPNEGIVLTGMVTENTKTKAGKDFYDFFYQKYNLSPRKSTKIIKVEEIISFGRSTRIRVEVDDRIIFQFFAKPKLDYLKEMADEALRQLNRYLEYLENRNESITQY